LGTVRVPIALAFVLCHPLESSRVVAHTHLSPYFIHAMMRCESMPGQEDIARYAYDILDIKIEGSA